MTYPGYMALSNDDGESIELINAARVKAYTDNLAPTMGLRGCEDCDGLEAAVGAPDGYTTPAGDNAPWYDPTDPETADFYGIYPLRVDGIDDSTRSIESAELSGDGSIVVNSRFSGKDIRVSGVAFAKDEAALYAGRSWLDSALNGTEDGRCFGDRLNVFSSCPPVQVLDPNFATPYTLGISEAVNMNRIGNPSFESNTDGVFTPSSGIASVSTVTTANTIGSGLRSLRIDGETPGTAPANAVVEQRDVPVTGGQWVAFMCWVRRSVATPGVYARAKVSAYTGTSYTGSIARSAFRELTTEAMPANNDLHISLVTLQTPFAADNVRPGLEFGGSLGGANAPDGFIAFTDGWIASIGDTEAEAIANASTYFDGNTPDTADFLYAWLGTVNNSASTKVATAPILDEAANWTTTSGTIQPWPGSGGTDPALRFDWLPGDPQKIACRQITGLLPGEQYQLRADIPNFGDYSVRIGDTCAEQRRNLAPNPRMLDWSFSGAGVSFSAADITTGGPLGLGYRRAITTSSNAGSPFQVFGPAEDYVEVEAGSLYQASIYTRAPVGIARLSATFRDSGGGTVQGDVPFQSNVTMTGEWINLTGSLVAPEGAVTASIFVAWTVGVGTVMPNMEFAVANLLVEVPSYEVLRNTVNIDPRAIDGTDWNFNLGVGGAVTETGVTGAVDGPVLYGSIQSTTYRRFEVTTEPTSGSAGPLAESENSLAYPDPIESGTPWVTAAFFRSNRTVSGTAFHRLLGPGGVVLDEFTQPFTLTANTWTYIAGGDTTTTDLTDVENAYVWLAVGGAGGGAAIDVGDIYDAVGSLIQIGSSDSSYYDFLRPVVEPIGYVPFRLLGGFEASAQVLIDDPGTYFDGYTDGFHWEGTPDGSISGSDQGIDYQVYTGWSHQPPAETTVLDFIPRSDSVYLSITPTQNTGNITDLLFIYAMSIRRTERPGVVALGTGYDVVPPSDGWTHLAPDEAQVTWVFGADTQQDTVLTIASMPSGSSLTYTTSHGIERTVYGMIPGNRYRMVIEFTENWAPTDSDPQTTMDPFAAISNSDGLVATFVADNDTQHFWVIEFTPLGTSAVIAFHPGSNLSMGSQGSASWSIDQFMVEEILETDATEPDPGRFQARTMYEVKASQGPILSNLRRASCGVMAEITYSLRAGNPFKYRNPIFAGGLPTGTSVEVADVPCSDGGLPQIINFAYNPSLETNADDWAAGGTNVTGIRSNLFGGRVGSYAFIGSAVPGLGRLNNVTAYYDIANVTSGPIPLPGDELTVSVYVRTLDLSSLGVYDWILNVTMAGFPPLNYSGTVDINTAETWYRIEQTFVLPSNVDLELIEMAVLTPVSLVTGGELHMDGLMIQRGSVATEAFDETFAEASWTGDPNTSALALDQVVEDISDDPDCPAPPTPPAPPEITNACVSSPTSYNRTVVSISEDTVPLNLTAYPVITLVAGSSPVRQARIRFWPNPDNLTINDIGACDYEGEIVVSYLSDGATMIIDGVLQNATVSKPGFDDADANHVLYGPNGGPVEWPELTGGIPYLVTLELDATEAYTDTLMSVDLVVKD